MKEHPPKHSSTHPQKSTKLKVEKEALFNPETSFFSQNNSTQSDRPFFTNIPANPFFKAASPPIQMKGAKINNDPTLEKDADKMGDKASQMVGKKNPKLQNVSTYTNNEVIQAKFFNLQQPMTAWDQMLSPGIEGNEKTSQETVLKLLKITQLIDQFQSASSALIAKNKLKALQEFLDSWDHKSLLSGPVYVLRAVVDLRGDTIRALKDPNLQTAIDLEQATSGSPGDLAQKSQAEVAQMKIDFDKIKNNSDFIPILKLPFGQILGSKVYGYIRALEERLGGALKADFIDETAPIHERARLSRYVVDFQSIENFLRNKEEVKSCLEPLNEALKLKIEENLDDKPLPQLLAEALQEQEVRDGFTSIRVIPLGVLPAEDFLDLIGRGIIFEDFGAGVGHGQLSHRIQWAAISQKIKNDGTRLWNHTVKELYQQMGKKPFDKGLISGNAMWGKIVDRSGLGDYRMPITLNTELMGSPTFDAKTNEVTGEKPVENLEALQQALLEKARSGYKDYGERIYSDEPTREMVKAFEEEKGMDGYETLKSGQGAFNEHQREWKVLIHPGDRPAYEQTGN